MDTTLQHQMEMRYIYTYYGSMTAILLGAISNPQQIWLSSVGCQGAEGQREYPWPRKNSSIFLLSEVHVFCSGRIDSENGNDITNDVNDMIDENVMYPSLEVLCV